MIRETKTSRVTVKPHINALGEREEGVWMDPMCSPFFKVKEL